MLKDEEVGLFSMIFSSLELIVPFDLSFAFRTFSWLFPIFLFLFGLSRESSGKSEQDKCPRSRVSGSNLFPLTLNWFLLLFWSPLKFRDDPFEYSWESIYSTSPRLRFAFVLLLFFTPAHYLEIWQYHISWYQLQTINDLTEW